MRRWAELPLPPSILPPLLVRWLESICVIQESELEAHSASTAAAQTDYHVTPAAGVGGGG